MVRGLGYDARDPFAPWRLHSSKIVGIESPFVRSVLSIGLRNGRLTPNYTPMMQQLVISHDVRMN